MGNNKWIQRKIMTYEEKYGLRKNFLVLHEIFLQYTEKIFPIWKNYAIMENQEQKWQEMIEKQSSKSATG